MNTSLSFHGKIPQHYEDLLTPFLFDSFSTDLMQRIDFSNAYHVLELAGGTGSVTRQLVSHLPAGSHLTATDLQADMLEVAQKRLTHAHVSWDVVDMTNIPYADNQYDLIVCQFGLMLVPEKMKALREMRRVLKKGGRLIFSVWADMQDNPVWDISGKVIGSFIGSNPMLQDPGPFSMAAEDDTLKMLSEAGFISATASSVKQTGQIESAALAAEGFIQGLPVFMAISKKDPTLIERIQTELERQLTNNLGSTPLRSSLRAWVFEAIK